MIGSLDFLHPNQNTAPVKDLHAQLEVSSEQETLTDLDVESLLAVHSQTRRKSAQIVRRSSGRE